MLFDLDGTLLDTAPDMHRALNALRRENGLDQLPYDAIRPYVSHGAAGVVRAGFGPMDDAAARALQRRFIELYSDAICIDTKLFPGMDDALGAIAARGLSSGIVTNKAAWLTERLIDSLGLRSRFVCIVSGDTVAERKPHPLPLLHAASLARAAPEECIYIGDAARDVQAAHAAGMPALVARYGYFSADEDVDAWGGDGDLESPADLIRWLAGSGRL